MMKCELRGLFPNNYEEARNEYKYVYCIGFKNAAKEKGKMLGRPVRMISCLDDMVHMLGNVDDVILICLVKGHEKTKDFPQIWLELHRYVACFNAVITIDRQVV